VKRKEFERNGAIVRSTTATDELYGLAIFCVHSFIRQTTTELFALKHSDIAIAGDEPRRLLVTVRNAKPISVQTTRCQVQSVSRPSVWATDLRFL
jgi:hypothetical protein